MSSGAPLQKADIKTKQQVNSGNAALTLTVKYGHGVQESQYDAHFNSYSRERSATEEVDLSSSRQSNDQVYRAELAEPRFGHDFNKVRVHSHGEAALSTHTYGEDPGFVLAHRPSRERRSSGSTYISDRSVNIPRPEVNGTGVAQMSKRHALPFSASNTEDHARTKQNDLTYAAPEHVCEQEARSNWTSYRSS